VAIGDFDNDGAPDLAAPSNFTNTVSVLPGNGDGTFGARTDVGVQREPRSVAIGDLNADGRADLVVVNHGTDTVSSLLGNGDGTFGSKMGFSDGQYPYSLVVGDLNGDGKPDVVLSGPDNGSAFNIWVQLGNGDGTFGGRRSYNTGGDPYGIVMDDFNSDGRPDLAVVHQLSNNIGVLLNTGSGRFGIWHEFGTGINPRSLTAGDLNGDGKVDIATANENGNATSVLLGNGDGTFGHWTDYATGAGACDVAIADFDGDGNPDLATANRHAQTVSVLLGNGDGTFKPRIDFNGGGEPFAIVTGDFNADGRPDVAVGASHGAQLGDVNRVSVLLGSGDGTLSPRVDYVAGLAPIDVAVGDVDADGRLDLVVATTGRYPEYIGTVSVLPGRGDGTFAPRTAYATAATYSHAVAIDDLDLDGWPDLVVVSSFWASVFLNKGEPVCPPVPVDFAFSPNTLNLRSMGHWVTGTLEPAPPVTPADIDIGSILLNGTLPVDPSAPVSIGDADGDGVPDLTVKFDRAAVELILEAGDSVVVTVTGTAGGGCFEAADTIRVLHGTVSAPAAGAELQGGTVTEVRWDTPEDAEVQSVAVLFSADDGATWNLVAYELPNTGSYLWTVPAAGTGQARVAVVLVESADPSGYQVTGILAVSGRFSVTSALGVGERGARFALDGANPNPGPGLTVSFSLASDAPATLAAFDISGRRVASREVGALGLGHHVVRLGRVPAGVYVIRLTQAGRSLTARAVVTR